MLCCRGLLARMSVRVVLPSVPSPDPFGDNLPFLCTLRTLLCEEVNVVLSLEMISVGSKCIAYTQGE